MDQQSQQPLVCPSHTTHYIIAVIVGLLIGTGASFVYLKPTPDSNNTYQAGFDAAKKLVEESNIGAMFRTPDDIRTLSGTVTAVSGNTITLRTQSVNPFEDAALASRTITVASDTKIFKLEPKDPKVMQAEMAAFMKATQSGKTTLPTPPTPFTSTPSTIADIATGSTISVTAVENIKSVKAFTASEVQVQQYMAPTAPATVPPTPAVTAPIK